MFGDGDQLMSPYGATHASGQTKSARRRQLHHMLVLIAVLLPFTVYALAFWLAAAGYFVIIGFELFFVGLLMLYSLWCGWKEAVQGAAGQTYRGRDPRWLIMVSSLCLFALFLGCYVGDYTYVHYFSDYYDIEGMNIYDSIDPSTDSVGSYTDLGIGSFVSSAEVTPHYGMVYYYKEAYCVAPIIVNSSGVNMTSYDFWSVGTDCCSGMQDAYLCADVNANKSLVGLRVVDKLQEKYYTAAVGQARIRYGINATDPIFFAMTPDPVSALEAFRTSGLAIFGIWSALVVVCALLTTLAFGVFYYDAFQCPSLFGGRWLNERPWRRRQRQSL